MQKLRHKGFSIAVRRHHLKAVYVCTVGGTSEGRSENQPIEAVCTVRMGDCGVEEAARGGDASIPVPITFSIKGSTATLRPWDPGSCMLAAGIWNDLIHLPIQPGCWNYAVDCSLLTLSHIADIAGSKGRLIGVWDENSPDFPTKAERLDFQRMYPNSFLLTADVKNATLESFERMLSLPASSKHIFLMALHPRIGADSPVRKLLQAEEPSVIFRHIFSFLECGGMARIKCMVFCHWARGTRPDDIRDLMLRHMDIMQRWRVPPGEPPANGNTEGDGSGDQGAPEEDTAATAAEAEEKSRKEVVPQWILLGIPLDNIADSQSQDAYSALDTVIDAMKRLGNGHRTGLQAKEQLRLVPHFPKHALLLLKNAGQRDSGKSSKTSSKKSVQPPKHDAVPMPSFGNAPPGLTGKANNIDSMPNAGLDRAREEVKPARAGGVDPQPPVVPEPLLPSSAITLVGPGVKASSAPNAQPRVGQQRATQQAVGPSSAATAPPSAAAEPRPQEWQQLHRQQPQQLAVTASTSRTQHHSEQLKQQLGHNQSALAAGLPAGPEAWGGGGNWQAVTQQQQLALAARAAAGGLPYESARWGIDMDTTGDSWHIGPQRESVQQRLALAAQAAAGIPCEAARGATDLVELAQLWQAGALPQLGEQSSNGPLSGAMALQQLRSMQQAELVASARAWGPAGARQSAALGAGPPRGGQALGWPPMEPPPGLLRPPGLPGLGPPTPGPPPAWPPPLVPGQEGGRPGSSGPEYPPSAGPRRWGAAAQMELPPSGPPWGQR